MGILWHEIMQLNPEFRFHFPVCAAWGQACAVYPDNKKVSELTPIFHPAKYSFSGRGVRQNVSDENREVIYNRRYSEQGETR
jgi:hypothetical protein